MGKDHFFAGVFEEVCDCGTGMRLDSGYWVIKSSDQSWDDCAVESILELFWHVICDLANTMERSVADLWINMS